MVFLFFLGNPSSCLAQDFLFEEDDIPGSYRIEYGGLYKIIVGQTSSLLKARWLDQEEIRFQYGEISYPELNRRQGRIRLTLDEWRYGTPWYYRHWWHSLPEEKGGAPKVPKIIHKGKTIVFLDLGLIYFTTAGEVKWRGLEMSVDFDKKSSITLGVGRQVGKPRSGWKFKVYPNVRISTGRLFTKPLGSIRRVDINIGGVHSIRGRDLIAVIFNTWYNFEHRGWFFGLQLKLMQW
jgi:hypothetical protein